MSANQRFRCYGQCIETDFDLSAYLAQGCEALAAARLHRCETGTEALPFASPFVNSHGREVMLSSDQPLGPSMPGRRWHFDVAEVARFDWRGGAGAVGYALHDPAGADRLPFWTLHILLPLYLAIEGVCDFLHASAVTAGGGALLFLAPTSGGKSTLARYFVERGHELLADDKVAHLLNGSAAVALPAHACCRPYRRAEDLGPTSPSFSEKSLPIAAVFALHPADADAAVAVSEIGGFEKFDRLARHFLFGFARPPDARMAHVAALAGGVRMFRLEVPRAMERLADVYRAVMDALGR